MVKFASNTPIKIELQVTFSFACSGDVTAKKIRWRLAHIAAKTDLGVRLMHLVPDLTNYSRTLVTQTLKGNEKQFELAGIWVIGVD